MAGVQRGMHQNTKLAALSKVMQAAPVVSTASAMSPASVALPYWSCSCIWTATSSPAVHRPSAAAPRSTACNTQNMYKVKKMQSTIQAYKVLVKLQSKGSTVVRGLLQECVFVRGSEDLFLCVQQNTLMLLSRR